MATTPSSEILAHMDKVQKLYLALNGRDSRQAKDAYRELNTMGFAVSHDPASNSYVIAAGNNPTATRTGSLSQRPASRGMGGRMGAGTLSNPKGLLTPRTGVVAPSDTKARADILNPPVVQAVAPQAPRSAYSMGAPALDDRVDSMGRPVPGTQSFVRGLFGAADNTNAALAAYKKQNPNATPENDPQLQALQAGFNTSLNDATSGAKWASMSPSARQSVLTQGELRAGRDQIVDRTQQGASELRNANLDRIAGGRPTSLLEDNQYYNATGVMRGGAGANTSTTQAGGVITTVPNVGATLVSPYGKGSSVQLSPAAMAARPEARIEGAPASQYFDKAAMRQGQTFDVSGNHYSPELSPADYQQKQLEEAKRKTEEERKKFAKSTFNR